MTAVTSDSHTMQFRKTKLCKFEQLGRCTKGPMCPFAHGDKDLRSLPDLRCTRLCKTLLLSGSCNDRFCTYAHSKDELRGAGHKSKGSKCNFAHASFKARNVDVQLNIMDALALGQDGIQPPPGLGLGSTSAVNPKKEMRVLEPWGQLSPAYVPLPSTSDATKLGSPISQPMEESQSIIKLKFDNFFGDEQSVSTKSPMTTPTPPSPPSPTKEVENDPSNLGFYSEGLASWAFGPNLVPRFLDKVPGLDGFGPICNFAAAEVPSAEPYFGLGHFGQGMGPLPSRLFDDETDEVLGNWTTSPFGEVSL